ncbi:BMP family ABC transporter substrate-binding protein [Bacteroidota bacterium]
MKKNTSCILVCLSFQILFFATSCKKNKNDDMVYAFKVGLLVDAAGLDDKSFNHATWEGIQRGLHDIPFCVEARIGQTSDDYPSIIQYFIDQEFDLIIAPGYLVADAMVESARQNPETDFLLLDVAPDSLTSNLVCGVFDVDQASFPCGFLAAYWALQKDPIQPVVGYVGGPGVPVIQQLSVSFTHGVAYFNNHYQRSVVCMGANTSDFVDSIRGAQLADSLIGAGAEVIFAFAGKAGNGALAQTKFSGKWGIGMDSDQYISYPEVQDILLTSCLKNLGNMVYQQLVNYYHDDFPGGKVIHGDLANQEVGMAPYHDFESLIPDSVKNAIENVKTGIIEGTIDTGW